MISKKHQFTDIAISEIHQFNGYDIFLRKDNIIQLQIYEGFNGDLSEGKNMINVFSTLKTKAKCLVLVVAANDAVFNKENRDYVSSDEVSEIIAAEAVVINGLAAKIMLNGYLRINKPNRPSKFFNSETDAVNWLKQFEL